jgi:hypothetical protein
MDRREIFEKVVYSADRFGAGNPQQSKLFGSTLNHCVPEEVFHGLLAVFIECPLDERHYPRQELAGRLLEKIKPMYRFELEPTIRQVLSKYNLSIEQLPQHFVRVHGRDKVLEVLGRLAVESLPDRELASVRTMWWWLTGEKHASERSVLISEQI